MKIKICGITNKKDAFAAVDSGADAVGFILYEKSKRYIEPAKAVELARQLPPFVQRVAVTVDMPTEMLVRMDADRAFDVWQLHGHESAGQCGSLRPRRLIKALGLPLAAEVDAGTYAGNVDAFLLDKASPEYGGTGGTFDWDLAVQFMQKTALPCILSGGLNPDNVIEAIRAVKPYAVDVCSGVEQSHGIKDHRKLKEFIELCRAN